MRPVFIATVCVASWLTTERKKASTRWAMSLATASVPPITLFTRPSLMSGTHAWTTSDWTGRAVKPMISASRFALAVAPAWTPRAHSVDDTCARRRTRWKCSMSKRNISGMALAASRAKRRFRTQFSWKLARSGLGKADVHSCSATASAQGGGPNDSTKRENSYDRPFARIRGAVSCRRQFATSRLASSAFASRYLRDFTTSAGLTSPAPRNETSSCVVGALAGLSSMQRTVATAKSLSTGVPSLVACERRSGRLGARPHTFSTSVDKTSSKAATASDLDSAAPTLSK
mmetsp:Transcript_18652/g.37416  ORF Transcript_18652/g.37416 Transcript_18652/m.37416 type:complete len:288 (+) Transcript_18652:253-1116(+)